MMLEPSRYDKWAGGGGGGGGSNGGWAPSRERDRERERERLARAHQMSNAHPPEQDASSLFSAPFRVVGGRDSQQIQTKLGDYQLAKTLLDDPSKSIGIYAEPQSPAPCLQSSRRDEFKKPNQTLQNGRTHPRQTAHNKSGEVTGSSAAPPHRPPPIRIPNGFQHQNAIDSSQPPIESILKEMKSLPAPLSVIAATPRKELDNKFVFNPLTNKVQENTQLTNNDLKLNSTKPGLDNRISNSSRSSVSPERVIKEPVLSESDDEAAATTTRLPSIISPIGSGGSPSSGSTSPSESESETSSTESSVTAPPPAADPERVPSMGWSLSNFIHPSAQFSVDNKEKDDKAHVQHVLDDVKEKPSPISELSDTSVSSQSPAERRRTSTKRQSPMSSDDEQPTNHSASGSVSVGLKRGRPPKCVDTGGGGAEGVKRRRGRPPKSRPPSIPTPPPHNQPEHKSPPGTKLQIFRKLFAVKKGDEGGGKGGKGGKGKGGKGKGQVTIIEVTSDGTRTHTPHSHTHADREPRVPPLGDMLSDTHRLDTRTDRDRSVDPVIERVSDRLPDRLSGSSDRLSGSSDRLSGSSDRLSGSSDRLSVGSDRLSVGSDRLSVGSDRMSGVSDRMSGVSDRLSASDRPDVGETEYVKAEADVGSPSARPTDNVPQRVDGIWVQIPLSRLKASTLRTVTAPRPIPPPLPPTTQVVEPVRTNHERTPIYFSYFERLPADALSDEERDHKYYLSEAKRLRTAAEKEQDLLQKIMLYLESVLCFVLTGRVLELELETKKAFTIYRETIEYIKSIHSMPQRFRASPHSTFSKLDILSLRVQALLYLRMFKMYNREVKEYYKIVQEYQQKPALPESISPVSPSPSPAGSVTSLCSGTSSGYCSLAHSVPALAHNALLQLTKYYTFLYVAHDLWEQADCLCRLPANQDLFIAVDRKCGPLTLFSTFRHLVQYVRHAISLLKHAPRE